MTTADTQIITRTHPPRVYGTHRRPTNYRGRRRHPETGETARDLTVLAGILAALGGLAGLTVSVLP